MRNKKLLLLIRYSILYNLVLQNNVSVKALTGHNIRLARENEFPFIAGILKRSRVFDPERDTICTASLISDKDILTAEHCVDQEIPNGLTIIVGSVDLSSRLKYYPAWWLTFDQYAQMRNMENAYYKNDICLLRLTSVIGNGIPPAKLSYMSYNQLKEKRIVTAGWGEINNGTLPRKLYTGKLKIMNNDDCKNRINAMSTVHLFVDKNVLCSIATPFISLMGGDSGGPILYQNKIVAISTGTCPLPQQQFHPDKVNVHTNIRYYNRFISYVLNTA